MDAFGVKTLWDDHGVVSDILVSPFILQNKLVLIVLAAVYSILSMCRYSRTHGAGPTPSNHQGYLQRPPCRVGWRVSDCYAWQFSCSSNNGRHRSPVRIPENTTLKLHRLTKHFSIAAVPLFPGLRRFPQGRGFKQWTGDDSKALMKVCTVTLSV